MSPAALADHHENAPRAMQRRALEISHAGEGCKPGDMQAVMPRYGCKVNVISKLAPISTDRHHAASARVSATSRLLASRRASPAQTGVESTTTTPPAVSLGLHCCVSYNQCIPSLERCCTVCKDTARWYLLLCGCRCVAQRITLATTFAPTIATTFSTST